MTRPAQVRAGILSLALVALALAALGQPASSEAGQLPASAQMVIAQASPAADWPDEPRSPPGYRQYRDANGVLHITNVSEHPGGALVHGRARPPQILQPVPNASKSLAERARPYNAIIEQAAAQYDLPVALVRAVVRTESNYNPRARSYKGAMGLMQLMPATARWLGVEDAYDPVQNVFGGSKFLRLLANRFKGDMVLVIAGYHAGAGAVQKYGGVPPYSTTRAYVKAVMRRFYAYRGQPGKI